MDLSLLAQFALVFVLGLVSTIVIFVYISPRSELFWKRSDYIYFISAVCGVSIGFVQQILQGGEDRTSNIEVQMTLKFDALDARLSLHRQVLCFAPQTRIFFRNASILTDPSGCSALEELRSMLREKRTTVLTAENFSYGFKLAERLDKVNALRREAVSEPGSEDYMMDPTIEGMRTRLYMRDPGVKDTGDSFYESAEGKKWIQFVKDYWKYRYKESGAILYMGDPYNTQEEGAIDQTELDTAVTAREIDSLFVERRELKASYQIPLWFSVIRGWWPSLIALGLAIRLSRIHAEIRLHKAKLCAESNERK